MKFVKIFIFVAILVPFTSIFAESNFPRTLKMGMSGSDVLELQKTLNLDPATRIAESGPGSKGKETVYFGPATKQAVVKFQEKYRKDILIPSGLSSGTGVFGEKTRIKMLEVVRNPTKATVMSKTNLSQAEAGIVTVMFPSQYSGKAGTTITLSGDGFTATDNTIFFGTKYALEKAESVGGANITFNIPSVPKGIYPLWVRNSKGESNKDAFFVILDGATAEPKITSIIPEKISRGGSVTIKGEGFTTTNNMVRTGVAVLEGVPSIDGQTLSVPLPTEMFTSGGADETTFDGTFSMPIRVYVVNENGISNGANFTLTL